MRTRTIDVTGIGNAIVDVVSQVDDAFLREHSITKGAMQLIDAGRARDLYRLLGPGLEVSGGSAANTATGLAAMGGRAAFVGKVRDDHLGSVFRADIARAGVRYETPSSTDGPDSACCLVLVTPDAQRSMNTYLGACTQLDTVDIDPELIADSAVIYLEGYLWDPPGGRRALQAATAAAHRAGSRLALSLSDPHCVERHRDDILRLLADHVDILFCNEDELRALCRTDDLEVAIAAVVGNCDLLAVTRGAHGSIVIGPGERHQVPALPAGPVVDTTGAGDIYAAGFLFGLVSGEPLGRCGEIASAAAGEIITRFGARFPDRSNDGPARRPGLSGTAADLVNR
ncbi:MAG: adenosine kinase [Alphaproteobacteria bacterium]|nr:adenosine kinase [Alphaproteobacteria bacterium]